MIGPSSFQEAFHLATMGGAEVLGLADVVGNFLPGKQVRQCLMQYSILLFLILFDLQAIRDGIPHPVPSYWYYCSACTLVSFCCSALDFLPSGRFCLTSLFCDNRLNFGEISYKSE